jgi:hypothetical protein
MVRCLFVTVWSRVGRSWINPTSLVRLDSPGSIFPWAWIPPFRFCASFCYMHHFSCYWDPCLALFFFYKIPNKFPGAFGIFFSVFMIVLYDKSWQKIGVLILVTCLLFLVIFFVKYCYVLTMIFCYVVLIHDMWLCDVFISEYMLVLCVQVCVSCLASNERFLVKIKCKICLKVCHKVWHGISS